MYQRPSRWPSRWSLASLTRILAFIVLGLILIRKFTRVEHVCIGHRCEVLAARSERSYQWSLTRGQEGLATKGTSIVRTKGLQNQSLGTTRPRLSVVTSLYQGDRYFETWAKSMQTVHGFEDYEWIIGVVGEPSDVVTSAMREFHHPNVYYVAFDSEAGLYEVWNALIRDYVRSPCVTNANLDDLKSEEHFRSHLEILEQHPEIDAIAAPSRIATKWPTPYENSARLPQWWRPKRDFQVQVSDLFQYDYEGRVRAANNLPHAMPIWKRTLHDTIGYFDESLDPLSDWDFWLRVVEAGFHFRYTKEPLGVYLSNPSSYARQGDKTVSAQSQIIRRHQASIGCRTLQILFVRDDVRPGTWELEQKEKRLSDSLRRHGHQVQFTVTGSKGSLDDSGASIKAIGISAEGDLDQPSDRSVDVLGVSWIQDDSDMNKTRIIAAAGKVYDVVVDSRGMDTMIDGEATVPARLDLPKSRLVLLVTKIYHSDRNDENAHCTGECREDLRRKEIERWSHADLILTDTKERLTYIQKLGFKSSEISPYLGESNEEDLEQALKHTDTQDSIFGGLLQSLARVRCGVRAGVRALDEAESFLRFRNRWSDKL